MFWHPATCKRGRALYSSNPELLARFVKESALNKREMLPDLDHVDVTARQETLTACQGQPVLVQVPLVPSYALTVHKTQALSIKHIVRGCLEGVFAMGQVYVLFSRVTDPRHLELIGHLCLSIVPSHVICSGRPTSRGYPRGRLPRLGAGWPGRGRMSSAGHQRY